MTLDFAGSVQMGDTTIPTDGFGRMLINYRGPDGTFPRYSISDILDGKTPAGTFQDKIVLIGATAIGIYDLRVTPFSNNMAGIEKHASVVDNILRGDFLLRIETGVILLIVFFAVLFGVTLPRLGAGAGALSGGTTYGRAGISSIAHNRPVQTACRTALARTRKVYLAGKESGVIPFPIEKWLYRNGMVRVMRFIGHSLLNVRTPIGRKVRPGMLHRSAPLIRVKPRDLAAAGIERVARVAAWKALSVEDRTVVIDFRCDQTEKVYPMVASGTSNDDIILGPGRETPRQDPSAAPLA